MSEYVQALELRIKDNAGTAAGNLEKLADSLGGLKGNLEGGGLVPGLESLSKALTSIKEAAQGKINFTSATRQIGTFVTEISKIGTNDNVGAINKLADALGRLVTNAQSLTGIQSAIREVSAATREASKVDAGGWTGSNIHRMGGSKRTYEPVEHYRPSRHAAQPEWMERVSHVRSLGARTMESASPEHYHAPKHGAASEFLDNTAAAKVAEASETMKSAMTELTGTVEITKEKLGETVTAAASAGTAIGSSMSGAAKGAEELKAAVDGTSKSMEELRDASYVGKHERVVADPAPIREAADAAKDLKGATDGVKGSGLSESASVVETLKDDFTATSDSVKTVTTATAEATKEAEHLREATAAVGAEMKKTEFMSHGIKFAIEEPKARVAPSAEAIAARRKELLERTAASDTRKTDMDARGESEAMKRITATLDEHTEAVKKNKEAEKERASVIREAAEAATAEAEAAKEAAAAMAGGTTGIGVTPHVSEDTSSMTAEAARTKEEAAALAQRFIDGKMNVAMMKEELAAARTHAAELRTQLETGLQSGTLSNGDAQKLADQFNQASAKANELAANIAKLEYNNSIFGKMESAIGRLKTAFASVSSSVSGAVSALKHFGSAVFNARSGLIGFLGQMMRMAKYRMFRALIRNISEGFSTGLQNVREYSKAINGLYAKDMQGLDNSLLKMKNSLGAAVAPMIQALIPVFRQLISWVITASNYINQFFALINGASTWTRAVEVEADSLEETEDKAKGAHSAMKNLLADFDELNIIQSKSGGGGGGVSTEDVTDYTTMFEEVNQFDEKVRGIVQFLKDNLPALQLALDALVLSLMGLKMPAVLTIIGLKMSIVEGAKAGAEGKSFLETLKENLLGGAFIIAGAGWLGFRAAGVQGALIGMAIGAAIWVAGTAIAWAIGQNSVEGTDSFLSDFREWVPDVVEKGMAGAIIGGVAGGVKGALIGFTIGAAIGLAGEIIDWEKNRNGTTVATDFGTHLRDNVIRVLELAATGAALGFAVGGPAGALVGLLLGASVGVGLEYLKWNRQKKEGNVVSSDFGTHLKDNIEKVLMVAAAGAAIGWKVGNVGGAFVGLVVGAGVGVALEYLKWSPEDSTESFFDSEAFKGDLMDTIGVVATGALLGLGIGLVVTKGAAVPLLMTAGAVVALFLTKLRFDQGQEPISFNGEMFGNNLGFTIAGSALGAILGGSLAVMMGGSGHVVIGGAILGIVLSLFLSKLAFDQTKAEGDVTFSRNWFENELGSVVIGTIGGAVAGIAASMMVGGGLVPFLAIGAIGGLYISKILFDQKQNGNGSAEVNYNEKDFVEKLQSNVVGIIGFGMAGAFIGATLGNIYGAMIGLVLGGVVGIAVQDMIYDVTNSTISQKNVEALKAELKETFGEQYYGFDVVAVCEEVVLEAKSVQTKYKQAQKTLMELMGEWEIKVKLGIENLTQEDITGMAGKVSKIVDDIKDALGAESSVINLTVALSKGANLFGDKDIVTSLQRGIEIRTSVIEAIGNTIGQALAGGTKESFAAVIPDILHILQTLTSMEDVTKARADYNSRHAAGRARMERENYSTDSIIAYAESHEEAVAALYQAASASYETFKGSAEKDLWLLEDMRDHPESYIAIGKDPSVATTEAIEAARANLRKIEAGREEFIRQQVEAVMGDDAEFALDLYNALNENIQRTQGGQSMWYGGGVDVHDADNYLRAWMAKNRKGTIGAVGYGTPSIQNGRWGWRSNNFQQWIWGGQRNEAIDDMPSYADKLLLAQEILNRRGESTGVDNSPTAGLAELATTFADFSDEEAAVGEVLKGLIDAFSPGSAASFIGVGTYGDSEYYLVQDQNGGIYFFSKDDFSSLTKDSTGQVYRGGVGYGTLEEAAQMFFGSGHIDEFTNEELSIFSPRRRGVTENVNEGVVNVQEAAEAVNNATEAAEEFTASVEEAGTAAETVANAVDSGNGASLLLDLLRQSGQQGWSDNVDVMKGTDDIDYYVLTDSSGNKYAIPTETVNGLELPRRWNNGSNLNAYINSILGQGFQVDSTTGINNGVLVIPGTLNEAAEATGTNNSGGGSGRRRRILSQEETDAKIAAATEAAHDINVGRSIAHAINEVLPNLGASFYGMGHADGNDYYLVQDMNGQLYLFDKTELEDFSYDPISGNYLRDGAAADNPFRNRTSFDSFLESNMGLTGELVKEILATTGATTGGGGGGGMPPELAALLLSGGTGRVPATAIDAYVGTNYGIVNTGSGTATAPTVPESGTDERDEEREDNKEAYLAQLVTGLNNLLRKEWSVEIVPSSRLGYVTTKSQEMYANSKG